MIRIERFGGLVPRLDAARLPDTGAQAAHNVDLTGGVLRPLRVEGAFASLHDAAGVLESGIPAGEVVRVAKPAAPVVSLPQLFKAGAILEIYVRDWATWIDATTGERQVNLTRPAQKMVLQKWWYTETGIEVVALLEPYHYTLLAGAVVSHRGPKYQIRLLADPTGEHGGPDTEHLLPSSVTADDPELPVDRVPLYNEDRVVYGFFEVTDVAGPTFDEDYVVTDYPQVDFWRPSGGPAAVHFTISLNYTEPRRRFVHYVWSVLDEFDREGPPSEISERATVPPGAVPELALHRPANGALTYSKMRVYRSGTGGDDFRLLKEQDLPSSSTFVFRDNLYQTQGEEIPPFGNWVGDNKATFLSGSVLHPGHFGAAKVGNEIHFSDPYRLHAWPPEYILPFEDDLIALALSGNSILAWAAARAYGLAGSHPEHMASYLLSETAALLSKPSLCRIGERVYYAAEDGLAVATAGGVEIASKEFFNREHWASFNPATLWAKTADGALFLEPGEEPTAAETPGSYRALRRTVRALAGESSDIKLVFRFGEGANTLATYDSLAGAALSWQSKDFTFEQPQLFEWVQVDATGSVEVRAYADGVQVGTVTVTTGAPAQIVGAVWARRWSFALKTSGTVRQFSAYEREVRPISEEVTLTPADTPNFRDVRLRFGSQGRIAAGRLSTAAADPVTITFYQDGRTAPLTVVAGSGKAFRVPQATAPAAGDWTVSVGTDEHVSSLALVAEQTVPVAGDVVEVNGGFPPWYSRKYQVAAGYVLKSLRVLADSAVTLTIEVAGTGTTFNITDADEVRLDSYLTGREFRLYFGSQEAPQDHLVREVRLHAAQPVLLTNAPYAVMRPDSTRGLWFQFQEPNRIACIQVTAAEYGWPLVVRRDGVSVGTFTVEDGGYIRLPRTAGAGRVWELDFAAPCPVESIGVFPLQTVNVTGDELHLGGNGQAEWLWQRYRFSENREITGILSSQAGQLRFYKDGGVSAQTVNVGLEPQAAAVGPCQYFEVDYAQDADNELSVGLHLFVRAVTPWPSGGLQIAGRGFWRRMLYSFDGMDKPVVGQVVANGAVTLVLTPDAGTAYRFVTDGHTPVVLDGLPDGGVWEVDCEAGPGVRVESVLLMQRQMTVVNGVLHESRVGGLAPWLYRRYDSNERHPVRAVEVLADSYTVPFEMVLTRDGVEERHRITSAQPVLVSGRSDQMDMRFVSEAGGVAVDHTVREVTIYGEPAKNVGLDGAYLGGETCWRGLRFSFPAPVQLAAVSVSASNYTDLRMTLYADGAAAFCWAGVITSGAGVRLPYNLPLATVWTVDLDNRSDAEITGMQIKPLQDRMMAVPYLYETGRGNLPPWLYTRYTFADPVEVTSYRLAADGAEDITPVLRDGNGTELQTLEDWDPSGDDETAVLADGNGRPPGVTASGRQLQVEFSGDDARVAWCLFHFKDPVAMAEPAELPTDGLAAKRRRFVTLPGPGEIAGIAIDHPGTAGDRVKLYGDGVLVANLAVTEPGLYWVDGVVPQAREWEIDCDVEGLIQRLVVYPRQRVQVSGKTVAVERGAAGPAPWLYTEYEFQGTESLCSAKFHGTAGDQTLRVWVNGGAAQSRANNVSGKETVLFLEPKQAHRCRFDFNGGDDGVDAAYLFCEEEIALGNAPLVLRNLPAGMGWKNKVLTFPQEGRFVVGKVRTRFTDGATVTVTLTPGATTPIEVTDQEFVVDMAGAPGGQVKLEVEALGGEIEEFVLQSREESAFDGGAITIRRNGAGPWFWVGHHFVSEAATEFSCGRVLADGYNPVTLRLYGDGVLAATVTVTGAAPFRLPKMRACRRWRVDVAHDAGFAIQEVSLARSMQKLGM